MIKSFLVFFGPRLALSFALVFGVAFFFFVRPQQTVNSTVNNHLNEVQNLNQSLQNARERLKLLSSPDSIKPSEPGARMYANQLDDAKGVFTVPKLNWPPPVKNIRKEEKVIKFNAVLANNTYRNTVVASQQALKADQDFILHHAAVMRAVANLLEYNPEADLSSGKEEEIYQRLIVAKEGLDRALKRLDEAPKYTSDKTVNEVKKSIQSVQGSLQKLTESLSKPEYAAEKKEFAGLVKSAQVQIIKNRAAFWEPEKTKLIEATEKKQRELNFHLSIIQNYKR